METKPLEPFMPARPLPLPPEGCLGWVVVGSYPVKWQVMRLLPPRADVSEGLWTAGGGEARLGACAGTAGEAGGLRGAEGRAGGSAAANTAGKEAHPSLGSFFICLRRAALLRQFPASCPLLACPWPSVIFAAWGSDPRLHSPHPWGRRSWLGWQRLGSQGSQRRGRQGLLGAASPHPENPPRSLFL